MSASYKKLIALDKLSIEASAVLNFDMHLSGDVVTIFDAELNYLFANEAACKLLSKQKSELEGKNLMHLFPHLTASDSHRNLLNALHGQMIRSAFSTGTALTNESAKFFTNYYPLKHENTVYAVIAHIEKSQIC
jgi:PAS domain-containing protein